MSSFDASPVLARLLRSLYEEGDDFKLALGDFADSWAGGEPLTDRVDWSGSWRQTSRSAAGVLLRRGAALELLTWLQRELPLRARDIEDAALQIRSCGARMLEGLDAAEAERISQLNPQVGRRLGRWVLREVLAEGSRSRLWRAEGEHGEIVALKVLRAEWALVPEEVELFVAGADRAARVAHAGSVRVLSRVSQQGPPWFYAMELVEGRAVLDELRVVMPEDLVRWALRIIAQVLDVLAAAHRSGVVHGAIWPANLMLCGDVARRVVLIDYGQLRVEERSGEEEAFWYRAPELAREQEAGPPADVYGAAATLAKLLWPHSGRPGPEGLRGQAERLLVPNSLRRVVQRALSERPEVRPTVAEFADVVEQHLRRSDLRLRYDGPLQQRNWQFRLMQRLTDGLRMEAWLVWAGLLTSAMILLPMQSLLMEILFEIVQAETSAHLEAPPSFHTTDIRLLLLGTIPLLAAVAGTTSRRIQRVARDWTLRGLFDGNGPDRAAGLWAEHRRGLIGAGLLGSWLAAWSWWLDFDDILMAMPKLHHTVVLGGLLALPYGFVAIGTTGVLFAAVMVVSLARMVSQVKASRVQQVDGDWGRFLTEYELACRWPRMALALGALVSWQVLGVNLKVEIKGGGVTSALAGLLEQHLVFGWLMGGFALLLWALPWGLLTERGGWHRRLLRPMWLAEASLLVAVAGVSFAYRPWSVWMWPAWLMFRAAHEFWRRRSFSELVERVTQRALAHLTGPREEEPAALPPPRAPSPRLLTAWRRAFLLVFGEPAEVEAFVRDHYGVVAHLVRWEGALLEVVDGALTQLAAVGALREPALVEQLVLDVPGQGDQLRELLYPALVFDEGGQGDGPERGLSAPPPDGPRLAG